MAEADSCLCISVAGTHCSGIDLPCRVDALGDKTLEIAAAELILLQLPIPVIPSLSESESVVVSGVGVAVKACFTTFYYYMTEAKEIVVLIHLQIYLSVADLGNY